MRLQANNSARGVWLVAMMLLCAWVCNAQTSVQPSAPAMDSAASGEAKSEALDYIVAIVNQDVILESDVQEEMHFSAFEPFHEQSAQTARNQALQRLINRTLILQQERLQPVAPVTDAEVQAEIDELRKAIPACAEYACDTEQGWQRFLAANDFTEQELLARWRERMEVLAFIEMRFRSGVRISPQQIEDFYKQTMLPAYVKDHATPPPLSELSDRIKEVLLERQVTSMLNDWLKTLREQGSVRTLQPGEEAP